MARTSQLHKGKFRDEQAPNEHAALCVPRVYPKIQIAILSISSSVISSLVRS